MEHPEPRDADRFQTHGGDRTGGETKQYSPAEPLPAHQDGDDQNDYKHGCRGYADPEQEIAELPASRGRQREQLGPRRPCSRECYCGSDEFQTLYQGRPLRDDRNDFLEFVLSVKQRIACTLKVELTRGDGTTLSATFSDAAPKVPAAAAPLRTPPDQL